MKVIFRLFFPDNVIVDHRPIGSAVVDDVRLECLPVIIEIVPPGLISVVEGIGLVDVESL